MCKLAKGDGSFNESFKTGANFGGVYITENAKIGGNYVGRSNYKILCCADCSNPSFQEFVPDHFMRQLFSGVWNMQPGDWMTNPKIDARAYKSGNAYVNGLTAGSDSVGEFLKSW